MPSKRLRINGHTTGPMAIFDRIFDAKSEDGRFYDLRAEKVEDCFFLRAEKVKDGFVRRTEKKEGGEFFILRAGKVEDGFVLRARKMIRRSDRI